MAKTDWAVAVKPLLKKYKNTPHPLKYKNMYQLLVMVVLSAQSTDIITNQIAPAFFKAFPDMASLSTASAESLFPYLSKIRNFGNKSKWLIELAQKIKTDKNIPLAMDELTELPGIGRKSANVIRREAKQKPQGVIVDLHVVRVAPRLGIANGTDPKKIEKQIMNAVPQKDWDVGMCMSFLGREICRPTNPKHELCVMKNVCGYYAEIKKKK